VKNMFKGIFKGLTVLVTGHTGFKGSWLSLWLQELGAHVIGFSLPAPTNPSHFFAAKIGEGLVDIQGDVRDFQAVQKAISTYNPAVIFHLAAQPLVLHSFEFPKETFDINVGGTINILEAARHCQSVKAMVMVTSDKCYENKEWLWGYRENDALGGFDPYSASKSMAEQAISSYRSSLFEKNRHQAAIASVRAGNVIGGGDFSSFRIVPDCMQALMMRQPVKVRNPKSVRPWLNVLDPLSGYLWLAARLLDEGKNFAEAWNFGPLEQKGIDVQMLVEKAIELWGDGDWVHTGDQNAKPEMGLLRLNWDKAAHQLQWRPTYSWVEALKQTVDWFKAFELFSGLPNNLREVSKEHIHKYTAYAAKQNISWATNVDGDSKVKEERYAIHSRPT
jgi:CDP-glucose 4,6-dehydratase